MALTRPDFIRENITFVHFCCDQHLNLLTKTADYDQNEQDTFTRNGGWIARPQLLIIRVKLTLKTTM
jgi:hypothetical protein